MYDFISLKLKCPVCGESLMDDDHLVDNKPSIRLDVEIADKKGVINLSSIYGSYNYATELEMPADEVAKFSCPHCKSQITSDTECLSCGSFMLPFYLDMGGKVNICSKNGCKNHFVEFEDLSVAMKNLYQQYGLAGNKDLEDPEERPKAPPVEKKVDEAKEILESGTFLNTYCPSCKNSLLDGEMLKLKIKNGEEGYLMLSPYMNVFTSKSTIFLPEDKVVKDLSCWHCNESLIDTEKKCEKCESPVAKISVGARTRLIDFYLCTKKGCRWHGLNKDDLYDIRMEDSLEW